ncbi:MAG: hypothetical protein GF320_03430 [Armatimonadia bacterium]|nr:hypothetical protein [Armatimonadia bacterium]
MGIRQDEGFVYYIFGEDDYGSAAGSGREVIDGVTHLVREFLIDDESLLVTQLIAPYRGLARIRYTVENLSDEPKQVAVRFKHQPEPLIPGPSIGGLTFNVQGTVFPAGYSPIEKETAYDVAALGEGELPAGWVSYSEDGTQAVGYIEVRATNVPGSNPKLERIEFIRNKSETRDTWTGRMDGDQLVGDAATMSVNYFFEAVSIEPGATDTFQLFLGNRWASENVRAPLHASAAARPAIRLVQDPDTGEYGYGLQDGTFPVGGYLTNRDTDLGSLEAGQLRNGAITIVLPDGLLLDDGSSSGTQTIGALAPGATSGVTWDVMPDPDDPRYGNLEIKLQCTGEVAGGVHARTVTRVVSLPALDTALTPVITEPPTPDDRPGGQFEMFSVPFDVDDPDPFFGIEYTSVETGQPITPVGVYRFDPSEGVWDTYPNGAAGTLLPGRSYFVRVTERAQIQVPKGASFLNDQDEVVVPLTGRFDSPVSFGGFNMVGNPFTYATALGEVSFLYKGRVRTYRDAWESGWLPGVVWRWNPKANEGRGGYEMGYGEDYGLNPWQGYWILANVNMEMIIEPPPARGAEPPVGSLSVRSEGGNGTEEALAKAEGRNSLDEWMLQVRAQSETAADSSNFMGVAPESSTRDITRMSIPEPPPVGAYVQLAFVRADEASHESLYAHDVRSMSADLDYEMMVTSNIPDETITLDWPTVHQLPRELSLVLEDVQTGERVFMRTEGAYSFNTGVEGTTRKFRVAVSTRDRGLQIASLTTEALARGGASIAYTLSADAEVDVLVMNAAGRVVRTVQAAEPTVAGRNVATWDGRSDAGTSVPSGRYTIKVTARSTEGGRVSQVSGLSLN